MSVELKSLRNTKLKETYGLLFQQIENLISEKDPIITNFANISAALKQTFDKISWVGFYFVKDSILYLGPFQGKVACTRIEIGNGVCGTSVIKKESQVVPNVHEFPGHIACDVESNSEIVVPLISNGKVYGVLDLDSTQFSAFDETDKVWLEKICELISNKLTLDQNLIL